MNSFENLYKEGLKLCEREAYKKAIEKFDEALAIEPNHTNSIYYRAVAKFRDKQFIESIDDFTLAISKDQSNAVLYSERGVAYFLNKQHEEAISDFDQAVKLEPANAYRYSSRGFIKDKIGDLQGALEDYQKAIKLDPEDAILYNNMGLLEEKMGRIEKAKANYKKADQLDPARFGTNEFDKPSQNEEASTAKIIQAAQPKANSDKKRTNLSVKKHEPAGVSDYFKVVRDVFTSKDTFKEFIQFISRKKK